MKPQEPLTKFFLSVLASLVVAAITANTVMLFQFGERLTRLETQINYLAGKPQIAVTRP